MIKLFLVIGALLVAWPRGYLLIYLIDRTKSMGFGFKFFAGWLIGIAGFSLDVFGLAIFNNFELNLWVFLLAAISQIFGFSFMIFLLERKLIYPKFKNFSVFIKKYWHYFTSWHKKDQLLFFFLMATVLIKIIGAAWSATNIPTYDFDAWNNWNLRAKVIYTQNIIPQDQTSQFYLGGGIKSYPLNDALLKVWVAKIVGSFDDSYINLLSVVYFILLLFIFYFSLPEHFSRFFKLTATYALSAIPFLYLHAQIPYADLYYSIFLFLSILGLYNYYSGRGLSWFYFSGVAIALGAWTKNEGLVVAIPLIFLVTLVLYIFKKVKIRDFLLNWFFAFLTALPWFTFRLISKIDILSGDSSSFKLIFNSQFIKDIFDTIFIRSNFNYLWVLIFAILILQFKFIFKDKNLRFLASLLLIFFSAANGIILFTDKALDLSALARVNLQLVPIAVLFVAFFFHKFFGRIKEHIR